MTNLNQIKNLIQKRDEIDKEFKSTICSIDTEFLSDEDIIEKKIFYHS